jgi:hypothetical protein
LRTLARRQYLRQRFSQSAHDQGRREKALLLSDIKGMFWQMRNGA